ncbi:MAG: SPOR domain-containing protein [Methylocella sp.]
MSEPIVKRRPMIDLEEFERRLRKPLAANQGDDDPLAELARFVGEQEDPYREDPYKTVFEPLSRRPAGTSRSGPDHGEGEDLGAREPLIRGDFAAIEAGLLGAARHESGGNLSESEDLDGCEEAEGAEHWRYEDTAAGSREAGPPFEEIRSRRPLYVMAAMIVAGIVGIGATFAFKGAVSHQDEVATIRAADGSAKIQPETAAAGTEIPNQDASILGGSPQPPPVAVVNNVEQPADLSAQANVPEAQADPPRAIAGLATGAASVPVPAPPAQAQPQSSNGPLSIAELIEPKKVKTVSVRPDGTLLPNDTPPQVTAPTVPVPAARPAIASVAKAATPKSAARVATTPRPAAPDANANPQPRTSAAAKAKRVELADTRDLAPAAGAPQASPGSFAVQLAAPGTEQEARETQVRLMKKFAAELAGFHTSIHKAAVGGKPVYRVRVPGFPSRDEAIALCLKLQSGGGNCFVAKN